MLLFWKFGGCLQEYCKKVTNKFFPAQPISQTLCLHYSTLHSALRTCSHFSVKFWRLHLRSPFSWLYKILLFWNSWSIWAERYSSARLPGLLYSIRNFCSVYFVLVTFWKQSQHSWPSILRLPKTTVENAVKHLHEPKSLCVIPLHTAPFPRLPEYLAGSTRQHMACTQGSSQPP